jgi:hypothetical protein
MRSERIESSHAQRLDSPNSQWLVRMQRAGAGFATLLLYKRDGSRGGIPSKKGRKRVASRGQISMLPPETASLKPMGRPARIGRRPAIREKSLESHRQFYPQGQHH